MKRERYEKRLFRILTEAGFTPSQILTISRRALMLENFLRMFENGGSHVGS